MTAFAYRERLALAALLEHLGPDAPTLCEGWTTADLTAHLLVRERRPDLLLSVLLPPTIRWSEQIRRRLRDSHSFPELVELLRRPPVWSLLSNPLTDEVANTVEFFVHHEDVRRAQLGWEPRQLPTGLDAALWRRIWLARMLLRKVPVTVTVSAPGFGQFTAGGGGPTVRLIGAPSELTLFCFGRQKVARVELTGPDEAVTLLRSARLGV